MSQARLSVRQCYNMGHNGHGINMYGVIMTLMSNLQAGGQSSLNIKSNMGILIQFVEHLIHYQKYYKHVNSCWDKPFEDRSAYMWTSGQHAQNV